MTTYTPDEIDGILERLDALESRVAALENPGVRQRDDKLKGQILDVFNMAPLMRFNRQSVAAQLEVTDSSSAEYQRITVRLKDLESEGQIKIVGGDTSRPWYMLNLNEA